MCCAAWLLCSLTSSEGSLGTEALRSLNSGKAILAANLSWSQRLVNSWSPMSASIFVQLISAEPPHSLHLVQYLQRQILGWGCREKIDFMNLAPLPGIRKDQSYQQLQKVHLKCLAGPGWDPLTVTDMVVLISTSKICWAASCIPVFAKLCQHTTSWFDFLLSKLSNLLWGWEGLGVLVCACPVSEHM